MILKLHEILIGLSLLYLLFKLLQLSLHGLKLSIAVLIVMQLRGVISYNVQHIKLKILLLQQQVLMLGVYVYEPFSQCFHLLKACRWVVDKCSRLATSHEFASQDAILGLILYVMFIEESLHAIVAQVEMRLYNALLLTFLDGFAVGPLP